MRPAVKRRFVTLAAAASLLLCIATSALWLRSYRRLDNAHFYFDRRYSWSISSLRGRVELSANRHGRDHKAIQPGFGWRKRSRFTWKTV